MPWVILTLAAVAVALVVRSIIAGRIAPDGLAVPVTSTPRVELSDQPLASEVPRLHFDTALIGYAVEPVDDALDALQARLAAQEKEIREWPSP